MKEFNIHITGVGGQGIGLLSQAVLRGIDHSGINAIAVDTHGLAQRGGVVVSIIRCGDKVHSPLIMKNNADLVLGMEVHEALRGLQVAARDGSTLLYLDVSWQPLPVRLKENTEITEKDITLACREMNINGIKVDTRTMEDSRMQNMALLGMVAKHKLVPGVSRENYISALQDLLSGSMLEKNRSIFEAYCES